jgi:hypothetical protein
VEGAAEGVGMHHHRITFHSSRLLVARMRVKKKYYHVFTNLLDYIDGTFFENSAHCVSLARNQRRVNVHVN